MKFSFVLAALFSALNLLAASDDENWETFPLPKGLNGPVRKLVPAGDSLYAVGAFTEADDRPATGVARWDGHNWSPVGSGLEGEVFTALADGDKLIIGGRFTFTTQDQFMRSPFLARS